MKIRVAPFDIKRHNDHTYEPPHPWTHWDADAPCWACFACGAAAGHHSPLCSELKAEGERNVEVMFTRMELAVTITSLRERFPGGSQTATRLEGILRVVQGLDIADRAEHAREEP